MRVFADVERLGNILCLQDLLTHSVSQCGLQNIFAEAHISAKAYEKTFLDICVHTLHM